MLRHLSDRTKAIASDVAALPREFWMTDPSVATAAALFSFAAGVVPALIESSGSSWAEIATGSAIVAVPLLLVPRWPVIALLATTIGSLLGALVYLIAAFELPVVLVLAAVASVRVVAPWILVGCGTVSLTVPYVLDAWLFEDVAPFSTPEILVTLVLGVTFAALSVAFGALLAVTDEQAEQLVEFEHSERAVALQNQRHEIARELHDVAAHHLAALSVRLRTEQMVDDRAGTDDTLAHAADRTDAALASMRQIVRVLRSEGAVQDEPAARIEDLDGLFTAMADAGIDVDASGFTDGVDVAPELQVTIVRLVREALTNALQHSEADRVAVSITDSDDQLTVTIDDPGPPTPRPADARAGFGLIGLNELVEATSGTFVSEATPERGWSTRATLPKTTSS